MRWLADSGTRRRAAADLQQRGDDHEIVAAGDVMHV
jgi:hypothetical protein